MEHYSPVETKERDNEKKSYDSEMQYPLKKEKLFGKMNIILSVLIVFLVFYIIFSSRNFKSSIEEIENDFYKAKVQIINLNTKFNEIKDSLSDGISQLKNEIQKDKNITTNLEEPKTEILPFITSYTSKDMEGVENFEQNVLDELLELKFYSQNSYLDKCFLNGVIRKLKPKKVLELGVAAGGTSLIILNALKDIPGSFLYSSDISEKLYDDNTKLTGHEVKDNCPDLMKNWKLYTGNVIGEYIEEIGDGIDLAFIDTNHVAPGEMLDVLMVLPFLKENATIVFHDTNLHQYGWKSGRSCSRRNRRCASSYTNGLVINYLRGDIYYPKFVNKRYDDVNIGAIKLSPNQKQYYFQYINILSIQWDYFPVESDMNIARKIISKYYGEKNLELYDMVVQANKDYIDKVGENNYYKGYNEK